jgi:hypothetical protein
MLKKASAQKTTFGGDLVEGMKLVLAHQRGKIDPEQVWPKPIDVQAIRKRLKLSQAARAYLTVIAKAPSVVRRALAGEALTLQRKRLHIRLIC